MAKLNCSLNKINNCLYYQGINIIFNKGDVLEVLNNKFISKNGETPDLVIVDPPFAGIDKPILNFIKKLKIKKILYVSCNSAT
jgi:23S rRNA (uracil1939-C5)-methyltransferase